MKCVLVALTALSLMAHLVRADDFQFKAMKVAHPFARATPPGAKSGGVYMLIGNDGNTPDKLVGVASAVADVVEVHQMRMEDGVMKMNAAPTLEINPHDSLLLEPGGYHVMLSGLRRPLKVGDRFPLQLQFERLGKVEVSVTVEAMGATMPRRPAKQ